MYKILSINYVDGSQVDHGEICYLDRANDLCEQYALNYVVSKEGEKYLDKPFRNKKKLPFGYSVVKKTTAFSSKYTVYFREKDGYIYSGNIYKVIKYFTFKAASKKIKVRKSLMNEDIKEQFSFMLLDLPYNCDEEEEIKEN